MKLKHIPLLLLVLTCCPACQNKKASATKEIPSEATYTNPLLSVLIRPFITNSPSNGLGELFSMT